MLSIVLQAGGKSTRMGTDKALLPFCGTPLIARLKNRFWALGQEMIVITNQSANYQFLDLPLYQDLIPDRGALGGLYTALWAASQPYVGLIAADLPFASPTLMHKIYTEIRSGTADAVIPSTARGLEPMHAVYRKETCLPLVKSALDENLWKMISWHDQAEIMILSPQATEQSAGHQYTFRNVNTPEEFSIAEEIARSNPGI